MRRILGRKRNLLMKADGSRFLPRAGFETFHKIAPIQQYQVVQHALDDVEFKLVAVDPLTPAQEEAFADTLRKALQFEARIRGRGTWASTCRASNRRQVRGLHLPGPHRRLLCILAACRASRARKPMHA